MRGVSGQNSQNSELSIAATVANNTEKNGRNSCRFLLFVIRSFIDIRVMNFHKTLWPRQWLKAVLVV